MLKVRVVLLLPEDGSIAVKAGYPPEDVLDEADLAAAKWAWQNDRAGRPRLRHACPAPSACSCRCAPAAAPIGVIGIDSDKPGPLLTPDERRLLDALTDQAALAIERVHLVEDMDRAKRSIETERLRSALLTSMSHDLQDAARRRSSASAETLKDFSDKLSESEKADLLVTIIEESERLNRFIANLLDMTKLEAGAIVPNAALHDLGEIVGSALERASKILARHRVEVDSAGRSADARGRRRPPRAGALQPPRQCRQICAGRHRRSASRAGASADAVCLQILDEGEGISAGDLERIFDKFYRAQKGDQVRAGTGLGLAISRGFVEAMHGTIAAGKPHRPPGAVFTIRLPIPAESERLDTAA